MSQSQKQYTDEELLASLQEVADGDRAPTQREFNERDGATARTLQNRFGSYNNAVEAAGLDTNSRGSGVDYTDEELLSHLEELAVDGVAPTYEELETADGPCRTTYVQRFGSYRDAIDAAELDFVDRRGGCEREYTDDELLSWIEAFYAEFGVVPRSSDFIGDGPTPSLSTYEKRFGSWCAALRKAEFEPTETQKHGAGESQ